MTLEESTKKIMIYLSGKSMQTAKEINAATNVPFVQIFGILKKYEGQGISVDLPRAKGAKFFSISDPKKIQEMLFKLGETTSLKVTNEKAPSSTSDSNRSQLTLGKNKKPQRDTSKFIFRKSEPRGKGQTVLAIMQAYVAEKNPLLYELKTTWPDTLVSKWGVTETLSKAKEHDRQRYFTKNDQILVTKDKKRVCVTNQWDASRFAAFLNVAAQLGYKIKPVDPKSE
jgi:hypothetical protein